MKNPPKIATTAATTISIVRAIKIFNIMPKSMGPTLIERLVAIFTNNIANISFN